MCVAVCFLVEEKSLRWCLDCKIDTLIYLYMLGFLDETFFPGLMDAGVIWVLLLIGHLYLIGVWLGDDRRTNTIKNHGQKRLDYVFNFYELIYSQ